MIKSFLVPVGHGGNITPSMEKVNQRLQEIGICQVINIQLLWTDLDKYTLIVFYRDQNAGDTTNE